MEEKILKALQEKGAMRPGDIAAAAGVDKEEAAKVIKKLAKEGNLFAQALLLRYPEIAAAWYG